MEDERSPGLSGPSSALELLIYRGLPASGKTTSARVWVSIDPAHRARVNRDDLRRMLHGGYVEREAERYVRIARDRLIKALLDQGVSVACDDTNLPQRVARDLARLGRHAGATVRVHDLTDVPFELCLLRDEQREESVGEQVIQGMYDRFLRGRASPLPSLEEDDPETPEPYRARPRTPRAIMVDLDGTLCLHNGRSPYDESRVFEDVPNVAVLGAAQALHDAGYAVVLCSGRTEGCRADTTRWLSVHAPDLKFDALLMRAVGDKRRDSIVKRELFDRHVRDQYDVMLVLDDRRQVVDAWRSIGLVVFQVAPGDF